MKFSNTFFRRAFAGSLAGVCALIFAGCEFESPITLQPTHNVDKRLMGEWSSPDGKEKMKIYRWDAGNYIVGYNGDLFRAYHSETAATDFVTVQGMEMDPPRYSYFVWKLSADGKQLALRSVNSKVIPKETKGPSVVQELLKKNLQNPSLLNEEAVFSKRPDPVK